MSVGCVVNFLNESELRKKKKPLENVKIAVNISGKISNKFFCGQGGMLLKCGCCGEVILNVIVICKLMCGYCGVCFG